MPARHLWLWIHCQAISERLCLLLEKSTVPKHFRKATNVFERLVRKRY